VALSPSKAAPKKAAIETKALALGAKDSKSAGMRLLFDAGYPVTQVAKVFGVGYAFAYGVAARAGKVETAAARRAPKRAAKAAPAKTATKRTTTAKAPVATVRKVASGGKPVTSLAAKAAKAPLAIKKPGRPSATRRAVNRKAAMTA
jgi:DNA-binding protein HU-beta